MTNPPLILYLEDDPRDAELVRDKLRQTNVACELRIATDQVDEGLIDSATAVQRLAGEDVESLSRLRIVPSSEARALCTAIAASIGVAVGDIVFDPAKAAECARQGRSVILVRGTTVTEDIEGIAAATGILTATGGRTSHAAVVARQLDKVCLVGCDALVVDPDGRHCTIAGETFQEGDQLSLDGHAGIVLAGEVQVETERPVEALAKLDMLRKETAARDGHRADSPAAEPIN